MDTATILAHVPQADPAFVDIVSRMPEPPPHSREQLLKQLPELHRLFLEKRRAYQERDDKTWEKVVKQEERIVAAQTKD